MKITGEGGGPFERMDHAQLIQGFSNQIKEADAHFLVSVVESRLLFSLKPKEMTKIILLAIWINQK